MEHRREPTRVRSWSIQCTAVAAIAVAAACAPDGGDCAEDRCAGARSRQEVLDAMAGYTDPVADYLREAVDERGALPGDYREILDGVAAITGCTADSRRTFIPL